VPSRGDQQQAGVFQEADGGTLFLDEIANMPLSMQVKLLRTIQEGEIKQVGSNQTVKVNVRFIAATNRDLLQAVEEGVFREDLYYRVNVITITLPDLVERTEDIRSSPITSWSGLPRSCASRWIGSPRMPWASSWITPGRATCGSWRTASNARGPRQGTQHHRGGDASLGARPPAERGPAAAGRDHPEDLEREAILRTLAHCNGNRAAAAKMLGLAERTLYRKLRLYSAGRAATASQGQS